MTKIYSYARTMKSNSDYANNMKRLSAQIFGEVGHWVILASLKMIFTPMFSGEKTTDQVNEADAVETEI